MIRHSQVGVVEASMRTKECSPVPYKTISVQLLPTINTAISGLRFNKHNKDRR